MKGIVGKDFFAIVKIEECHHANEAAYIDFIS